MIRRNYYYILVFTNSGPVYVTSIDKNNNYAHWDKDKEPMEIHSSIVVDIVTGLNCNFNNAVLIQSQFKIHKHPYNYEDYDCTFVKRKKEEE